MRLRVWLYRVGLLRREKVAVPVISVGNLTMGGTGKTPLVMYVVRLLQGMGYKPAILSRGYGRSRSRSGPGDNGGSRAPLVVADGRQVLLGPESAGDEPVLLARSLPGVPVLVGARRRDGARYALARLAVDCLVLDDGFQHLALERGLDLALFSARDLPGSFSFAEPGRGFAAVDDGMAEGLPGAEIKARPAAVFPGGPLREPWSALQRADAVVITGLDRENRQNVAAFRHFIREQFPRLPIFVGEYLPVCLVSGNDGKTLALAKGQGRPLYGFSGIAQPESFRRTLEQQGFLLTGFHSFPDHHAYTTADYQALLGAAQARRADGLITTEKDLVKLLSLSADYPLLALRVALFMEAAFDDFMRRRLAAL